MGKCPLLIAMTHFRFHFGRRLRGRTALPPAQSGGFSPSDQRNPMSLFCQSDRFVHMREKPQSKKPKPVLRVPFYWDPRRNPFPDMILIGKSIRSW